MTGADMFFTLLIVTFVVAFIVSFAVVQIFDKPVSAILKRIIADDIYAAWHKYIKFAAYVVGVSGGVRVFQLERYISVTTPGMEVLQLNAERWTLEVYRTIIGSLQSIAWMFLVFFVVSLVAFVIVRIFEFKHARSGQTG
jgi:hypothetical protein